ncbi:hypothetical protein [Lusitaniella coriacea]|uniref:hypothetical protein n=1 Tax=Lusitaniella coriacea TaxID=1983105 RepID=UPI003CFA4C57
MNRRQHGKGGSPPDAKEQQDGERDIQLKRLRFLHRSLGGLSPKDALGLLAVATLSLHVLLAVGLFLLYGSYARLVERPAPSLVQLSDGTAIEVAPLGSRERTPEVVKRFAVDALTLMMNWSGTLPAQNAEEVARPQPDPGIELTEFSGRQKVTTAAWQGSFALSEDFRPTFLLALAEMTPPQVFGGEMEVALMPLQVGEPLKIAEGRWKLSMVANLMVFARGKNLGDVIPFNKEIFVRATEAPRIGASSGSYARQIAAIRASGLEIYRMSELEEASQ